MQQLKTIEGNSMGIGASILLLAIGAILAFATSIDSTPLAGLTIEWTTVGVILMIIGVIGLIWSFTMLNAWRGRRGGTTGVVERDVPVVPVERDRY